MRYACGESSQRNKTNIQTSIPAKSKWPPSVGTCQELHSTIRRKRHASSVESVEPSSERNSESFSLPSNLASAPWEVTASNGTSNEKRSNEKFFWSFFAQHLLVRFSCFFPMDMVSKHYSTITSIERHRLSRLSRATQRTRWNKMRQTRFVSSMCQRIPLMGIPMQPKKETIIAIYHKSPGETNNTKQSNSKLQLPLVATFSQIASGAALSWQQSSSSFARSEPQSKSFSLVHELRKQPSFTFFSLFGHVEWKAITPPLLALNLCKMN